MKALDRITVIIFTLCIILSSVLIPISIIITRDTYYRNQFIKCGIYPEDGTTAKVRYIGGDSLSTAALSSEQFDEIIKHMTDYFSNKKQDFSLKMDNVLLNGSIENGVDIFGEEAVTHMDDVRPLFNSVKVITVITVFIAAIGGIYMLKRKDSVRKIIYKYSLAVVFSFFGIIALYLGGVFIYHCVGGYGSYFDTLWSSMHHIFFPFEPDKFSGSFFNDTLTQILSLEFFMNTVVTIVINLVALTAAWLFSAKLISKR